MPFLCPCPPSGAPRGMPATAGGCITGGGGGGTVDGNGDAAGGFKFPKELLTAGASTNWRLGHAR